MKQELIIGIISLILLTGILLMLWAGWAGMKQRKKNKALAESFEKGSAS